MCHNVWQYGAVDHILPTYYIVPFPHYSAKMDPNCKIAVASEGTRKYQILQSEIKVLVIHS